jgi:hypothetical protein
MDEAVAEYIPLARAAALVHDRLFPEQTVKEMKTLDLLALALSSVMALYQRDMQTGEIRPLTKSEVAAGRFTRGAMRLEFGDRPSLRNLVVRRDELGGAIKTLADDTLIAGRVSLTLRQGPRSSPASA